MCYCSASIIQTAPKAFPFWLETFSIFLGDVLASIFIASAAYFLWYILKYPGFRVGANWTYTGWDANKMGRLPNDSDTGVIQLMPNVSVVSLDMSMRKIIVAVWVRERKDLHDPGEIHGMLDLKRSGMPAEVRTTGGDVLSLPGPTIQCEASKFGRIFNCPIFIQTSDGEYYQAESPGNAAKGIVRLRYWAQNRLNVAKRWALSRLGPT